MELLRSADEGRDEDLTPGSVSEKHHLHATTRGNLPHRPRKLHIKGRGTDVSKLFEAVDLNDHRTTPELDAQLAHGRRRRHAVRAGHAGGCLLASVLAAVADNGMSDAFSLFWQRIRKHSAQPLSRRTPKPVAGKVESLYAPVTAPRGRCASVAFDSVGLSAD